MAVQRALVTSDWCKAETLSSQKGSTIINKFTGKGPAEALCCNWSRCNKDLSTAKLESQSQNSTGMVSNGSYYYMLMLLLNFVIVKLLSHL